MSAHTPGPWLVHLAQTVGIRAFNSSTAIARMFGSRKRAEANARLMAAAPDMLEVALAIELDASTIGAMPLVLRDRLLAAIAKATGGGL